MNILRELQKQSAYKKGIDWIKGQKDKSLKSLFIQALKEKKYDDINWGLSRLLKREDKIRYAIYAAKQVLSIFEKKYPKDKRPRLAIQAAENYLKNPSKENKVAAAYAAAYAAADAAADAAYAAYAADAAYADDAYDDAYDDVYDDAYAANAANANAANAAYAAADAANAAYTTYVADAVYAADAAYAAADATGRKWQADTIRILVGVNPFA